VGVVNGGPRCGWRIPTVAGMAYEAGVAPPAFATYQLQLRPLWLGSRPGGSHSTSMPKFHLFSCRSLFRSHFLFLFIFFLVSCLRKSRLEAFMQLNVKITWVSILGIIAVSGLTLICSNQLCPRRQSTHSFKSHNPLHLMEVLCTLGS
jgi:hypothetical protein